MAEAPIDSLTNGVINSVNAPGELVSVSYINESYNISPRLDSFNWPFECALSMALTGLV